MSKLMLSLDQCFEEGAEARAGRRPLSDNPYCRGSDECGEWQAGWRATLDLDEEDDPASDRLHRQDEDVAS